MNLKSILFPDPERSLPHERTLRPLIRVIHLASMGVLLGGHFFDVPAEQLCGPLYWTVGSGVAFMATDVYCSCHWFFQVRGLLTLLKIALVCLVPLFWTHRIWILMTVVAIGAFGSHMTSKWRYYSILSGEVKSHKKG